MPSDIAKIGLTVSYDMGWNKRSTCKVYDSLSGHDFLIDYRTGNVTSMGVKKGICYALVIKPKNYLKPRTIAR